MQKSNHNDSVILCSGGLDSTTLVYWLCRNGKNPLPLFINYGQHCATTEFSVLKKVLPNGCKNSIEMIDVSQLYRGSNSRLIREADLWIDKVVAEDMYLPYRNMLLLSLGAAFAQTRGIRELYAAFINSNHAKEIDCSSDFFNKLGKILDEYGSVEIVMPFREMTKKDVVVLGNELNVPIAKTYSCQISSIVPCGACPNCVERNNAFDSIE